MLTKNRYWFPFQFPIGLVMEYLYLFENSFHVKSLLCGVQLVTETRRNWGFPSNLSFSSGFNEAMPFLSIIYGQGERVSSAVMVGEDARDFKRVLCKHKEIRQDNNNAILVIISKVEELEQSNISHNVNLSNLLFNKKVSYSLVGSIM